MIGDGAKRWFFLGTGGHPQVVQTAGRQHDLINHPGSPVAKSVGHDAAPLHPGDGVFHRDPRLADDLVDRLLDGMEFTPTGFLLGLEGGDARRLVTLEARVLEQQRVGWVRQLTLVGELLVVHAAGRSGSKVNDSPLVTGHEQILLSMRFLLAAVVVFFALLVLGPANGPLGSIDDQQAQLGYFLQELGKIGGSPGRQDQFPAQRRVDQGGEPSDPQAHLRLAQAKEHAHDLLERVALEIEEYEKQPGLGRGQHARVAGGPGGTLALLAKAVEPPALSVAFLLEGGQQPGELARFQAGQRSQQLGFAENGFHVHAPAYQTPRILSTIMFIIWEQLQTPRDVSCFIVQCRK